jgi:hypothetical protein
MTTTRLDDDFSIRPVLWSVTMAGAVLTVASPFALGSRGVVGVAVGALLATANLWALGRVVRAFLQGGGGLPWVVLAAFKLVGLLAVVGALLALNITAVLPLAVGYAALPIGIVLSQLRGVRPSSAEATAPHFSGHLDDDASRKG